MSRVTRTLPLFLQDAGYFNHTAQTKLCTEFLSKAIQTSLNLMVIEFCF